MTRMLSTPAPAVTLTVRYFAGAKAAAGTRSESVALGAGATVADLVDALVDAHGGEAGPLARVLAASSLLLDETAVHDRAQVLPEAATVDVLPPFAGG